ncbi:septal ring lytic transglycosylase RlpA family protein [Methyloligella solikamskensis]|uniref:Endolytic peptidoglycan transglycosylase RlpA n=1 Tax=Methyloligella solikamskensis TaxID=1177756 RepID=A0ABW3J9N3_9HYPH
MPNRAPRVAGAVRAMSYPEAAQLLLAFLAVIGLAVMLNGCGESGNGEKLGPRVIPLGQPVPKGGGRRVVGKPYKVAGRWYEPKEVNHYTEVGTASWYGELFHGRRTANGEIYDMNRLSAAHRTLPLPALVRVTNLSNRRTIVVRVNDRGPFSNNRIIDLSSRAAHALGYRKEGVAKVQVTYMGPAPINGDDSFERQFLAQQRWTHYASNEDGPRMDIPKPMALGSLPKPPTPTQKPAPAPSPQLVSAPAQSAPSPQTVSSGSGYAIQAGSFSVEENAMQAHQTLGGIGRVDVAPVTVNGTVYYRVQVGPFGDRISAETARAKVAAAGYSGARVVNP